MDDRAADAVDRQSAAELAATELRLAESEAVAWRLLQAEPSPALVVDVLGVIRSINAHAVWLFGYQADELIGQPVDRLIPGGIEQYEALPRSNHPETDSRNPENGWHTAVVRKDGAVIPVAVHLSTITLATGPALLASISDLSDRALSRAELRFSDEHFRVSFDRAPIGMALIDLQPGTIGRFLRVNRALCEMTGFPEAVLLATSCTDLTHLDERAETAANLAGLANGVAERWDTDKRYRSRSGRDIWVHVAISVVHDPGGNPSHGVSQVEDIRNRKDTEAQLEERFRELATNVDVGFLLRQIDPPKYLYYNPAYLSIFGFDPAGPAPTPQDSIALTHPQDVERVSRILGGAARGERVEQEWRFTRPDGQQRWVSARVTPIFDGDGEIRRVAGLFEDITDRTKAAAVLAESQDQFQELANNVDVGFSIREAGRSNYLYLNSRFMTIFGFDPAAEWPTPVEVKAQINQIESPGGGTMAGEEATAVVVSSAGARISEEWRLDLPGGAVRWISSSTFPVLNAEGRVRRYVGIVEDITARKAVEDALQSARADAERANAAKTEFLSRMSHELRTPLNAILGFGQILEMDALSAQQRDGVRQILKAGEHLLGLIDEILDIARMEAGVIRLSLEPVCVADVIEQTVGMLAPLTARREVRIAVHPLDPAIHVLADHQRFKQVLVNILANAVKYNHHGGWVRIENRAMAAGRIRLTISDSGIGITEQDLGRLFRPFERLSAADTDVEGTGLGLALSKRLVTEMGGEVGVHSCIGEGSSFWVDFRTTEAPIEPAAKELDPVITAFPASTARRTVLYVEDNLSNVKLIQHIISRRPHIDLLVAMQGRIGLEMARAHRPDLILLDLHLPDMSGEDVLRVLRADPSSAEIPIVILSADATSDQPARLIARGANGYLTKPFNIPRVLDVIDHIDSAQPDQGPMTTFAPLLDMASALPGSTDGLDDRESADDGGGVLTTTFVHDLINLLGVILTYCDLLAGGEIEPLRASYLQQLGIATESAVELTRELFPARAAIAARVRAPCPG